MRGSAPSWRRAHATLRGGLASEHIVRPLAVLLRKARCARVAAALASAAVAARSVPSGARSASTPNSYVPVPRERERGARRGELARARRRDDDGGAEDD